MAPSMTRVAQPQKAIRASLRNAMIAGLEAVLALALVVAPWRPPALGASMPRAKPAPATGKLRGEEQIVHLLNRITFGARPGDLERVEQMGVKNFIEQQLHPDAIPDPAVEEKLALLDTLSMSSPELAENFPPLALVKAAQKREQEAMAASGETVPGEMAKDAATPAFPQLPNAQARRIEALAAQMSRHPEMKIQGPREIIRQLQQAKLLRAVYSERQLDEVMVDFWENHFNIFAAKGADAWLLTSFDRDVIRPHALGKFKDLVEATAHSPAMLFYLDNWLSVSPLGPQPRARNFQRVRARGPLAMRRYDRFGHPLPPFPRNQTAARPGPVNPIKRGLNENYARELMELHTLGVDGGYTQKDVTEVARCFTGWTIRNPRLGGGFFFNPRLHDNGVKHVLGHRIHAGGEKDGEEVINILVHHPSTAHFIAKELVTRFVSDHPPETLVERVAATYTKTDGDIKAMLRTILYSPEFNSREAYRAKVKSPFELVASAIRASGGDTNASPQLLGFIARMGEPLFLYLAPSGYPDRSSEWLNTGALLTRMNFALALAANRIPGTTINFRALLGDASPQRADEVRGRLLQIFLNGDAGEQTRAALNKDSSELIDDAAARSTAALPARALPVEMAGLILGSPEFQRR